VGVAQIMKTDAGQGAAFEQPRPLMRQTARLEWLAVGSGYHENIVSLPDTKFQQLFSLPQTVSAQFLGHGGGKCHGARPATLRFLIADMHSLGINHGIGTLSSEDFDRVRQARGRIPFRGLGNPPRLPAFVAFRDEKNPKTIYEVDPKNFGQSFPGVGFVGIDIEFTDAPVTDVLKQRLPWLENPNNEVRFERDPPGQQRAFVDQPIGFKISTELFFEH
jgi:hypothetical protein